jgi:hypothetical protein
MKGLDHAIRTKGIRTFVHVDDVAYSGTQKVGIIDRFGHWARAILSATERQTPTPYYDKTNIVPRMDGFENYLTASPRIVSQLEYGFGKFDFQFPKNFYEIQAGRTSPRIVLQKLGKFSEMVEEGASIGVMLGGSMVTHDRM